jgi:hypothetical protein
MNLTIAQCKDHCIDVASKLNLNTFFWYYDGKKKQTYKYSDSNFNIPVFVKHFKNVSRDAKFNLVSCNINELESFVKNQKQKKVIFKLVGCGENFILECSFSQPKCAPVKAEKTKAKAETVTVNHINYKVESSGQMALNI